MKKPSQTHRDVQNNVSTSGNKKKYVKPTKEVDVGINGGTSNLTSKKANSSSTTPIIGKIDKMERLIIDGTATLVDDEGIPLTMVDSLRDHDSDDEVASVDNDMTNFLASKDVGYGTNSLLEQWKESYGNGEYDYDPYNNDMYEGRKKK
ncbi:hypothetical protein Tco_0397663 [Tanacetum coccineum]